MNRRSLLLLPALLALCCATLVLVLRPGSGERALDADETLAASAPHEAASEAELQALAQPETRSAPGGPGLGTPGTPKRELLADDEVRVAGFLRAQSDEPWRNASVALVALGDGGPQLLANASCNSCGGFALGCKREGHALFVVLARGFVPRTQEVELLRGRELLLEDFELERGLSIEGALSSNRCALSRFEVVALDERELPRLRVANEELLWDGSRFDWRYTLGESGPDGRYSIGGLHAGPYAVRVATCRGPYSSLCANERSPRTICAPRTGVDFDFEASSLALRFSSAGQPLADVEVELECGNWRSGKKSDAQGQCLFELVPRLDCTFVASKAGFEALRLPVAAPESGASAALSFELRQKPAAAQLHLLVSSPNEDAPPTLRLRLYPLAPLASGAPEPAPCLDRVLHCTSANTSTREFVLPDAPPGRFRAQIFPGQPLNNEFEPGSYIGTHHVVEREIEVKPQAELYVSLSAERRGALRLEFPEGDEQHLHAHCTLRDSAGQELPIVLVDPALGAPLVGRELSGAGPTLLYAAVEGSDALLTVEHEGRTLYQGPCFFRRGVVQPLELHR